MGRFGNRLSDGRFQEAGRPLVGREQALDLHPQVVVFATRILDEDRTLTLRQAPRGLEQLLDPSPAS